MLLETQVSAIPAWGFVLAPQQGPRYCEADETFQLFQQLFLPDIPLGVLGLLVRWWILDKLGFKIMLMLWMS